MYLAHFNLEKQIIEKYGNDNDNVWVVIDYEFFYFECQI